MDEFYISPAPEKEEKKQKRRLWLVFLPVLPLLCAFMICASQLGLWFARPVGLPRDIAALSTADYSPWLYQQFAPINPDIMTEVARNQILGTPEDQLLVFVATTSQDATETAISGSPADVLTATSTETLVTAISTETPTQSSTNTQTVTPTPTITETSSATATATPTSTTTYTPTVTPSQTVTASATPPSTNTLVPPTSTFTPVPVTAPQALFSYAISSTSAPATAGFTNLSSGNITSYFWNFGDGVGTSTLQSPPLYTYTSPGTYTVSLTATGPGGSNTYSVVIIVNNPPAPAQQDDLSVSLSAGTTTPQAGQSINGLIFTVTNTGANTASGVSLQLALPSGLVYISDDSGGAFIPASGTWTVSNLASGTSRTLTIQMQASSGSAGTTQTVTGNIAFSTILDANAANNNASLPITVQPIVIPPQIDLSLSKTASVASTTVGSNYNYTFTVSNNGAISSTNVVVTDSLPAEIIFASSAQCSAVGQNVTCNLGTLANGANTVASITVQAVSAGIANNTATVSASETDANTADNLSTASVTISSTPQADISVTIGVDNPAPVEGATISYNVTITNNGTSGATGVQVNDFLPAGVTYVSNTPSQGTYTSGTGIWDVGTLANGATATLTITATVNAGTAGSTITNTASGSALEPDPIAANNSASVNIVVVPAISADMEMVTFTASNLNPIEDDTLELTVTVRNNGTSTATGVVVSATTGDSVVGIYSGAIPIPSQGTYDGATDVWTVGALAPSASATLRFIAVDILPGSGGMTITRSRTVSANEFDPNTANNTRSYTMTIQSGGADLEIINFTPTNASVSVGQSLNLTFDVRSNSTNNATNAVVTFPAPAYMSPVIHSCLSLSLAGGTYTCSLGTITAGSITNVSFTFNVTTTGSETTTFTVDSDLVDLIPGNNSASTNITILSSGADLDFTTFTFNNLNPAVGETIISTISITNNGPDAATNIVLSDSVGTGTLGTVQSVTVTHGASTGNQWTIPLLNNGETATMTITLTVQASAAGTTVTRHREIIASDQPDPDSTPNNGNVGEDDYNSYTVTVQPLTSADMSIIKAVDNPTPSVGNTIIYTLTATNNGPNNATSVQVNDLLPAGVTYVSNTPSQGTYTLGTGVWTIGSLANGASATLTISATVNAGTEGQTISNSSTISAAEIDGNTANNSVSVDIVVVAIGADLAVSIVAANDTPIEDDSVGYTITVSNLGSLTATNVQIQLSWTSGFINNPGGTALLGNYNSGTRRWTIPTINVGQTGTLYLFFVTGFDIEGTTQTATATITASDQIDPNIANNTASYSVTILDATGLIIRKSASVSSASVGQTFDYQFEVENIGPSNTTGVIITDTLPAEVSFLSSAECTASGQDVTCDLGALLDGSIAYATVTVRADSMGTASNTAYVSSDLPDGNLSNNQDSVTVTITSALSADMSISKVVNNPTPNVGNTIIYTLTATNNGPVNATGVQVNDLLPVGVTYVSNTASQGTYTAGTGVWNIGSLANGASATLTISATVDAGTQGQTIVNNSSISATETDANATNDTSSAPITVAQSDLVVASLCSPEPGTYRRWRVRNYNPYPLAFDWEIYGSGNTGTETAPAAVGATPGEIQFTTPVSGNPMTIIISVAGVTHDQTASNSTPCSIDLAVTKMVDNPNPRTSDTFNFTVTVSNLGSQQASGVVLNDLLPAGLTLQTATPSVGTYDPVSGNWNVGTLASGLNATLTLTVYAGSGTAGTTITNTATITAANQPDPNASNNSSSVSITVENSTDISVGLSASTLNPYAGTNMTFTVTATNQGAITATNTMISNPLPPGLVYVSDTSGGSYNPGIGQWTIPSLATGANTSFVITAFVDGTECCFTVTASLSTLDQTDTNAGNNSASVNIIGVDVYLAVTIIVDNPTPDVGNNVIYRVRIDNYGSGSATNIRIDTLLPAGLTYVSDNSGGSYNPLTGAWNIPVLASGFIFDLNITATVNSGTSGSTIPTTTTIGAVDQPDQSIGDNTDSVSITVN
ncbi:MAG: PKD domain-containing protein [Aggregatilineales bacterium]